MDKTAEMKKEGAVGTASVEELVQKLGTPRVAWMMLPAGKVIDDHVDMFSYLLSSGDLLVDGGNTYYKDDLRRAEKLKPKGIHYVDAGVSGGIWGLKEGYCLMIGGEKTAFKQIEPLLETLAPKDGYLYCGPTGAGHFVKMVHNGIEYGLMQAYGEGFSLLNASPYNEFLDFSHLAHLWNQGSVVRSWLLELLESAFAKDRRLSEITGYVEDSGEGRWTVEQAIETAVPIPVIAQSLFERFRSREKDSFSDRVLAALRREFGGHAVIPSGKKGKG
jgi:6-phosphogluconate dehydrogenase